MEDRKQSHIIPFGQHLVTLVALLCLTGITILVSQVDLGVLNVWIALLVASAKSTLVLLYFMHLKYENRLLRNGLIITLCFVAILIGFLFWDISYR